MVFYLMWLLNGYTATALEGLVTPPPVLRSIGVWGYHQAYPALLPLLLHLLTTVAVAGLSRSRMCGAAAPGGSGVGAEASTAATEASAPARGWGSSAGGGVFLPQAVMAAAAADLPELAAAAADSGCAGGSPRLDATATEGPWQGLLGDATGGGSSLMATSLGAAGSAVERDLRQLLSFRVPSTAHDGAFLLAVQQC